LGKRYGKLSINEAMKMMMSDTLQIFTRCRSFALAALLLAVAAAASPAVAQNVVVVVNGEPITAFDIEQRSKFIQLSTQKTPGRPDVLNELIDEKLKVKEAKRWGVDITDSDVDSSYGSMASRMRLTAVQLTESLAKAGIAPTTLKTRIKADLAWQQLVRGRYRESLQLSDKDVVSALETSKSDEADTISYDYVMRPILLLVPPGSAEAAFEGRRKEAEALRARFKTCEEGLGFARGVRDVAIRDRVIRSSGDLTPELRKILDGVPIGQLTTPEVTRLGVEMFALCAKQESKSDTPGKRKARDSVYNERFEKTSKRYLSELRKAAMIERK
jgi:peptidyl-prolyl cis-trans isomerase SurA